MTAQDKQTLRDTFVTDAIPTQQNFTDLIDTFATKVNNISPDENGNIAITIPTTLTIQNNLTTIPAGSVLDASQGTILNNRLNTHTALVGSENTIGHLSIQNFLGPNTTRAITANAVNTAVTDINARLTAIEARLTALETP